MTTIGEALRFGRAQLDDSPSPALDARLLLQHVLERDHAYLIGHGDEPLPAEALAIYRRLLERAAAHEPIPYLIGHAPFLGLDYIVSQDVLIPRPETEQLVETAIAWGWERGAIRIVDVGTGSGCIAVSLARHLPRAEVVAVDISAGALAVAAANVVCHAPGRVQLVRGDLLESIVSSQPAQVRTSPQGHEPQAGMPALQAFPPPFDLIAANLPYVAGHEWPTLPIGVKSFEPGLALDGGADGLELFRSLLPQSAERLRPGGLMLLEIGWRQGEAVATLARASFPGARVEVWPDFAGHDRIVSIKL